MEKHYTQDNLKRQEDFEPDFTVKYDNCAYNNDQSITEKIDSLQANLLQKEEDCKRAGEAGLALLQRIKTYDDAILAVTNNNSNLKDIIIKGDANLKEALRINDEQEMKIRSIQAKLLRSEECVQLLQEEIEDFKLQISQLDIAFKQSGRELELQKLTIARITDGHNQECKNDLEKDKKIIEYKRICEKLKQELELISQQRDVAEQRANKVERNNNDLLSSSLLSTNKMERLQSKVISLRQMLHKNSASEFEIQDLQSNINDLKLKVLNLENNDYSKTNFLNISNFDKVSTPACNASIENSVENIEIFSKSDINGIHNSLLTNNPHNNKRFHNSDSQNGSFVREVFLLICSHIGRLECDISLISQDNAILKSRLLVIAKLSGQKKAKQIQMFALGILGIILFVSMILYLIEVYD